MENLNRFLKLPFTRKRLLIESTVILMLARISLRLLPFKTMHNLMKNLERKNYVLDNGDITYVYDISWAIKRAGENLFGDNSCLPIALAGQFQLNMHGFPARSRLGVKKTIDGEIRAHAWVEFDGEVVIGGPKQDIIQYSVLSEKERPK